MSAVPAVPTDLADARERVAQTRTHLQAAESDRAARRADETAVSAAEYPTPAARWAAKEKAAKLTARADSDVEHYTDLERRAVEALRPLEIEAARAAHAAALQARTSAAAKVPGVAPVLADAVAPVLAIVREVAAGQCAVTQAARAAEKLGEKAQDRDVEAIETAQVCERVASKMRDATTVSARLLAIVDLVRHVEAQPERERARKQAAEDKAHAQYMRWREAAYRGDLGPEQQRKAEAEVKAATLAFYGPTRETMPKLSPELAAYYKAAGIKVEG